MNDRSEIRQAQSRATDAREAVRGFHAAVSQPDMALVMFFCSGAYDLDAVADELNRLFAGAAVVGCTTAGEIGPLGFCEHSIVGASFPADAFSVATGRMDRLREFEFGPGQAFAQDLLRQLEGRAPQAGASNTFALLLIDGLSVREEPVTRAFQYALGERPLVGGSAGDGLRFRNTYVFHDGRFHSDSALLVLLTTPLPSSRS